MRLIIPLFFLILFSSSAFAQEQTLTGSISDALTKEAVASASITVKGKNIAGKY